MNYLFNVLLLPPIILLKMFFFFKIIYRGMGSQICAAVNEPSVLESLKLKADTQRNETVTPDLPDTVQMVIRGGF